MSNTASHLLLESGLHFINMFESQLTSGSSYLHAAVEGRGRDPYHSERPDHYSNFPFKPVSITRDQKNWDTLPRPRTFQQCTKSVIKMFLLLKMYFTVCGLLLHVATLHCNSFCFHKSSWKSILASFVYVIFYWCILRGLWLYGAFIFLC